MLEPQQHPDLAEIGHVLQGRLDHVLEAEQEAAAVLARRMSTIRDRLLDAEDAQASLRVITTGGHVAEGRLRAVGCDHLELTMNGDTTVVALDCVEIASWE